jgi:hypothetical protein
MTKKWKLLAKEKLSVQCSRPTTLILLLSILLLFRLQFSGFILYLRALSDEDSTEVLISIATPLWYDEMSSYHLLLLTRFSKSVCFWTATYALSHAPWRHKTLAIIVYKKKKTLPCKVFFWKFFSRSSVSCKRDKGAKGQKVISQVAGSRGRQHS